MKTNPCTCSVDNNEQNCTLHKKSFYRNLFKEDEDETKLDDEETSE